MGYHYYYNDYYGSVDNLDGVAFYRTARNGEHSYYVDIMCGRRITRMMMMMMITKWHSDN